MVRALRGRCSILQARSEMAGTSLGLLLHAFEIFSQTKLQAARKQTVAHQNQNKNSNPLTWHEDGKVVSYTYKSELMYTIMSGIIMQLGSNVGSVIDPCCLPWSIIDYNNI